jgi:TetR/AcrR family transcriptional repressor of uid operon
VVERAFAGAFAAETAPGDAISERILDAAYEHFIRVGFQRATMDDVARRAGVSRITVYRRFAGRDALVEQVVRREFQRYFGQFLLEVAQASTAEERLVVGFVSSIRTIRANPLIGLLLAPDDADAAATLLSDHGRTLAAVRAFLAGQLRREQRAGEISADLDVDRVAEIMVRISASFLVFPSHLVDLDDADQLAAIARDFLVPMLSS